MTVPNIVEITNEIYQEVFRRRLSKKYVGRKVNNASVFNLRRNSICMYTLTLFQSNNRLANAIQSKNLVPGQRSISINTALR